MIDYSVSPSPSSSPFPLDFGLWIWDFDLGLRTWNGLDKQKFVLWLMALDLLIHVLMTCLDTSILKRERRFVGSFLFLLGAFFKASTGMPHFMPII